MTNNNVQNVKFLRNGSVFTPSADPVKTAREVALAAMKGQLNSLADGTAILGRYNEGTDGSTVKTLVGFAYVSGETRTLTVLDVDAKILAAIEALDAEITSSDETNVQVKVTEVDGKITAVNITTDNTVNSGDVATAIETEIGKLDVTDVAVDGQYVSQVSQADGKIAVTRVALPTVSAISEAGKPITAVSESLGTISATAGTINAEFVNIADSGSLITATNVEGALAEIAAEIDAMDKSASAVDGQVVTTVSEVDGVVSETKANVKDLQLGGYAKDTTATGDIASTDTINAALSKLENKAAAITIGNTDHSINVTTGSTGTNIAVNIKSGENVIKLGSDGIYTNLNVVKITESLPAEIKERYELRSSDNVKIGESIDIAKDSHIVSITYITEGEHAQNLEYVYVDVSGNTQTTYVDMSELVLEAEFESGVTATDGVVHGVVDPTSENFLTVGANGFKLAGVQDAIDNAIEALDATGGTRTIATDKHVAVEVIETDGKITTVTVVENNIADADDLATEITNRTNADTELSNRLGANVTTTNTAYAQLSALSGNSSTDTSATTSVEGAKIYTNVKLAEAVAGLNATVSGESADHKVNVKVTEANGVITAVDVVGSDIASAQGLANEIAHRKAVDGVNGDAYTADTTAHYISAATSLLSADKALDTALNSEVTRATTAEAAAKTTVQGSSTAASSNDAVVVTKTTDTTDNHDIYTIQLGSLDAGTY